MARSSSSPVEIRPMLSCTSSITALVGNSNSGHSFENAPGKRGVIGRLLTDDERWALVEYLKSIPEQAGRVTPFGGPANAALASQDPAFYQNHHPW